MRVVKAKLRVVKFEGGEGKIEGGKGTLCPAVHILGTYNVHSREKGTADHYWPWAVVFLY